MKTLLLSIILCLTVAEAAAALEVDMYVIAQIESSGNSQAYNEGSGAIGLCQITAIVAQEYRELVDASFEDSKLWDPVVNKHVGDWYMNIRIPRMLKYFHIKDTLHNRLRAYNWGIGNLVKYHRAVGLYRMPKETSRYIIKYEELVR